MGLRKVNVILTCHPHGGGAQQGGCHRSHFTLSKEKYHEAWL